MGASSSCDSSYQSLLTPDWRKILSENLKKRTLEDGQQETIEILKSTNKKENIMSFGRKGNFNSLLVPGIIEPLVDYLWGSPLEKFMSLSVNHFIHTTSAIERMYESVNNAFRNQYGEYMEIISSRQDCTEVYIAETAIRNDHVIVARIKKELPTNHSYSLRFSYQLEKNDSLHTSPKDAGIFVPVFKKKSKGIDDNYHHPTGNSITTQASSSSDTALQECLNSTNTLYNQTVHHAQYDFDVLSQNSSRKKWIWRDITRFHGDETRIAHHQPEVQLCTNDLIEFAIPAYTIYGLTKRQSIRFHPLIQHSLIQRECPLESEVEEWYKENVFEHHIIERMMRYAYLQNNQLKVLNHQCAGFDILYSKTKYEALSTGLVEGTIKILGTKYIVVPSKSPILECAQRKGLIHDRSATVYLRIGDFINLYVSQGGKSSF